jgi:hypothetical protein
MRKYDNKQVEKGIIGFTTAIDLDAQIHDEYYRPSSISEYIDHREIDYIIL